MNNDVFETGPAVNLKQNCLDFLQLNINHETQLCLHHYLDD